MYCHMHSHFLHLTLSQHENNKKKRRACAEYQDILYIKATSNELKQSKSLSYVFWSVSTQVSLENSSLITIHNCYKSAKQ